MNANSIRECRSVDISEEDILEAMKSMRGYIDITPRDFEEIYRVAHTHALDRMMTSIRAQDIMTKVVHLLRTDMKVPEAVDMLSENRISGAPVVDQLKRVVGVVSEKDIFRTMAGMRSESFMEIIALCMRNEGCLALPMNHQTVGDIMTAPAVTISADTPIREILAIVSERKVNRLPVIGDDGGCIGIVARSDVVQAYCTWV